MTFPLFYFAAIFIFADRGSDEIIYHGVLTKQALVLEQIGLEQSRGGERYSTTPAQKGCSKRGYNLPVWLMVDQE